MYRKLPLVSIGILLIFLTACSSTPIVVPNERLVQKALAVQLSQLQQQISQKLHLSTPLQLEIDRLRIQEQQQLKIGNLPAYRIIGTYDRTLQISQRRLTQENNPFEVYLQLQKEGKTWRLAIPQTTNEDKIQSWRTYLIDGW
ncbi:hypothetical protein B7486_36180 [cyanobacterium TDX16]|nr:hypothetical protein B7486_36180 [cyanobacterium TDX16]